MPPTEKPYVELGRRLEQFRKHLDIDKKTMAQQMDMQPQHYRNVANGYKVLTTRYLTRLAINHKELNVRWLLTGEGECLYSQQNNEELNRLSIENNLLRELLNPGKKKEA